MGSAHICLSVSSEEKRYYRVKCLDCSFLTKIIVVLETFDRFYIRD